MRYMNNSRLLRFNNFVFSKLFEMTIVSDAVQNVFKAVKINGVISCG